MNWPLSPLVSQIILWTCLVGPALLLAGLAKVSGRWSRMEDTAPPLHTHTCSRCGRIQRWTAPFDQHSPCRACQIVDRGQLNPMEIDLEDFADADAIRVYLNGADRLPPHSLMNDARSA